MSILDSLKLLNKPINELAMLPQETIMQLSQSHPRAFPPAYVTAVLGQKAEQAKAGAQAAAAMQQQQLPPSTVMERIISQNAVSEADSRLPQQMGMPPQVGAPTESPMIQMPPQPGPSMAPQMPPGSPMTEAGLASLPISEEAVPTNFAGGGIVAFDSGGEVQRFQNQGFVDPNRMAGEDVKPAEPISAFEKDLLAQQAIYDKFLGRDQASEDLVKYMKEADKRAAADQDRAFYRRIFKAGMNIMGGESPDPFVNIGKGAAPEIEGYMSDIDKQRAAELDRKKMLAEAQNKRRAEKAGILKEALENQAKVKAAEANAGKLTDTKYFAELSELAAMGDPAAKRKVAAMLQFAQAQAVAAGGPQRAEAALAGVRVRETEAETRRHTSALKYQRDMLATPAGQQELIKRKRDDSLANKASGAKPGDPNYKNSAQEYMDELYKKGLNQSQPAATPRNNQPQPAAAAPKGTLGTKENPLPMPKTAAEAQVGKVYMTSRGSATWDGKQFVPVK